MATKISVRLDGTIDVKLDSGTCPGGTTAPGAGFSFQSAYAEDLEASSALASVAGGPDPLPLPANMEGRFLYLKILSNGGPLDVTVTHATQGATVYPVRGLLILEPADDEGILGVTVAGAADFEWLVSGTLV